MTISDHSQRQRALTANESFIVQAPAGSGKTHLLTQRFLRLLTTVSQSQAILAITFTRKAAAQMRERIMDALQFAANTSTPPTIEHQRETWKLAKAALQHAKQHQWDLLNNPASLRIMTIDALCLRLTQQAPQLSTLYARQKITDMPSALYQHAVTTILNELGDDPTYSDAFTTLLSHLDNRVDIISQLLINMLERREQWLDIIVNLDNNQQQRDALEASLQHVITMTLNQANQLITDELRFEISRLYTFAAQQKPELHEPTDDFPTPSVEQLPLWQDIISILLTQKNEWRKQVDKRCGFPAPPSKCSVEQKTLLKNYKQDMLSLLAELSDNNALQKALAAIRLCPTPHYSEAQWNILSALLTLLPVVAAQLRLSFSQANQVDFSEISLGALYALHDQQGTTDLALYLDYQLQHILIDEFQDTSITQYRLLQALTSGWQPNDSRTLFLVGDPMQSIYRFRQADVSLFLRAKKHGIGDVSLTYLGLTHNFRSQPVIIDWLNQHFSALFPEQDNTQTGAIRYSPATATNKANHNATVTTHLIEKKSNYDQQTGYIVELIKQLQQQSPDSDIAILVRSRSHLAPLLPILRTNDIAFHAVDIERLDSQIVIQDLVNLTYALCYLADRRAWLGVLRAPFCGFTLSMLTQIVESQKDNRNALIWDCMQQAPAQIKQQLRFQHVNNVLQYWWKTRYQQPLHKMVSSVWYALGGANSYPNEKNTLLQANRFFNLLTAHDNAGTLADRDLFESALAKLYAQNTAQQHARVQIMTLHKSKGLEFDYVILPYLDKIPPATEQPLLRWQRASEHHELLLAPIKEFHTDDDPIYRYLHHREKQQSDHETVRLLYVGATRAKQQLHLIGAVQSTNDGVISPKSHSLLGLLWDQLDQNNIISFDDVITKLPSLTPGKLIRLTDNWYNCFDAQQLIKNIAATTTPDQNPLLIESIVEAAIGTVIHRCLECITIDGLDHWQQAKFTDYHPYWQQQLQQFGVPLSVCKNAIITIEATLEKMLNDVRGRWILSQHPSAATELRLSTHINGKIKSVILDRTFVADGYCWIIDYKTAMPNENESFTQWLQQQKAYYQRQLQLYAHALAPHRTCPIRVALYFPRIGEWIDWEPAILESNLSVLT